MVLMSYFYNMSFTELVATFKCEPELLETIETSLLNSEVKFAKRELETGDIRLFIPNLFWTISIFLTILNQFKEQIEGYIETPTGRKFEISAKGIDDLQKVVIESMSTKREVVGPAPEQAEPNLWIVYREEIAEIIKSTPRWIDSWSQSASKVKFWVVMLLLILIGSTLGVVTYLTIINRISGEALIFLTGTIIGYIFSFLQKYLGIFQTSS